MHNFLDGEFFIKKHCDYFKKIISATSANDIAKSIQTHCLKHIKKDKESLYGIFFYDCKPLTKKCHYPMSQKALDLSKTDIAIFRTNLHKELAHIPCLALRFGYLDDRNASWQFKDNKKFNDVLHKKMEFNLISDDDLIYKAKQKGVDMRIGLDIATLTYKHLVNKIVLISGNSNFVPAAKLARKEGIHFVS